MEEKLYMVIAADTCHDPDDQTEDTSFFITDISILGLFKSVEDAWTFIKDKIGVDDISEKFLYKDEVANDALVTLDRDGQQTVRFSIYEGEEESRLYSEGYRGSFIRILTLTPGAFDTAIYL